VEVLLGEVDELGSEAFDFSSVEVETPMRDFMRLRCCGTNALIRAGKKK
jgi:hypothetical protein